MKALTKNELINLIQDLSDKTYFTISVNGDINIYQNQMYLGNLNRLIENNATRDI